MRLAFKIASIFWILSPFAFAIARLFGKYNSNGYDWLIFIILFAIHSFVIFLNYNPDDSD